MGLSLEQCMVPTNLALVTVREWTLWRTEGSRHILPRFTRREACHCTWASLRGLLSPVERNNGWQWTAVHGDETLDMVQHLLGHATWDVEAVRDGWRSSLVEHMGASQAVLGFDVTGLLNKS